jgi:hypothetical protein
MNGRACACRTILLLLSTPLTSIAASADEHLLSYSGTATARHSSEFIYGERHLLRYRDEQLAERLVLYTCRDGSAFARKTVSYVEPMAPDFVLDDAANGMREGVRTDGTGRTMFFRGVRLEPERSGPVREVPGLVIDAGFDEFIRANWPSLMTGTPRDLHFLVPSRLGAMHFHVQRVRGDAFDGVPVEVFRLQLAGVLGWVLPAIDVSYGSESHVLMRYEGLSDLRDSVGDNFQTTITFHPGDRKPAEESEWASARQARLGPCR